MIKMTRLTLAIAGTLRDPYWSHQFLTILALKRITASTNNVVQITEKFNESVNAASSTLQQFADAIGNSPAIREICDVSASELTRFADLYPECGDTGSAEQRPAGVPQSDSDAGGSDADTTAVDGNGW